MCVTGHSLNQGHSPNRKSHVTARQSRRLTSGGKAVFENFLREILHFLRRQDAQGTQKLESCQAVLLLPNVPVIKSLVIKT